MRIAHIAPVATTIPPPKSGSVESMTSLLTEGLVERGHDVTLFATGDSTTRAKLHAIYPHGYWHDENMWPWELYEMLNLAAAVERAREFDIIHYEAAYYPMSLAFTRLSDLTVKLSDPSHTQQLVNAFAFGAGSVEHCHCADEHIDLGELREAALVIAHLCCETLL